MPIKEITKLRKQLVETDDEVAKLRKKRYDISSKISDLKAEEIRNGCIFAYNDLVLVLFNKRIITCRITKVLSRLKQYEYVPKYGCYCRGDRISERQIIGKVDEIKRIIDNTVYMSAIWRNSNIKVRDEMSYDIEFGTHTTYN